MLLSIIIPLAPADNSYQALLVDLLAQVRECCSDGDAKPLEIIVAGANVASLHNPYPEYLHLLGCESGRAQSMNAAANIAQGEYLWFLHADSLLDPNTLPVLLTALDKKPSSLLYFDLFFTGMPQLMRINSAGVKWRSRFFQCPFGDQAFCLSRQQFFNIGQYQETLAYGEDHLLVWQARQNGMALQVLPLSIGTSARKYQQRGWLRTSLLHIYLWLKQAIPAYYQLIKQSAQ